jgi:chromatin remodeling complex protein RSC6
MPVPVSKELAVFCGKKDGDLISRNDVTRTICSYIKVKALQDKTDGRCINPDKDLSRLLKYDPKSAKPLTYASIQNHLTSHYPRPVAVVQ